MIYANRQLLAQYHRTYPERLSKNLNSGVNGVEQNGDCVDGATIIGDVIIHPTAKVDPSAVVSLHFF